LPQNNFATGDICIDTRISNAGDYVDCVSPSTAEGQWCYFHLEQHVVFYCLLHKMTALVSTVFHLVEISQAQLGAQVLQMLILGILHHDLLTW